MHIKTPRLVKNRLGTYYFRIKEQGRERKFSLRTKCPTTAAILALQINTEIEKGRSMNNPKLSDLNLNLDDIRKYELEVGRDGGFKIRADDAADHARAMEAIREMSKMVHPSPSTPLHQHIHTAIQANAATRKPGKPLSKVLDLYLNQKSIDTKERSRRDKASNVNAFIGRVGDLPVNEYTSEHAVAHKNALLAKKLSPTRINQVLGIIREVFVYAVADKLSDAPNPFDGINLHLKKGTIKKLRKSYQAFTQDEINRIFAAPHYQKFMNKPGYFWVPLLAFYTGARLEDIAGLEVKDIQQQDGIWFFDVVEAKNSNSIRKVPLPTKILESGFMDYLTTMRSGQETVLFPHLTGGINGRGKNMGRRFAAYLDRPEVNIISPLKVFHSFRHTFINRMTELNTNPFFLMSLVGHYEQEKVDLSSSHNQNYQHEKLLVELKKLADQFDLTLPQKF